MYIKISGFILWSLVNNIRMVTIDGISLFYNLLSHSPWIRVHQDIQSRMMKQYNLYMEEFYHFNMSNDNEIKIWIIWMREEL